MKDLVDINYLLSKILTKVFGYFIRFVHILNKKNIEIHKFKDSYDDLYSDFFSRLDNNNEEIIVREECPICGSKEKVYKFSVYKFPIVKCGHCSLIYRQKTISQFTLGRWRVECADFYYKGKNELTENMFQKDVDKKIERLGLLFKKTNFTPQGKNFLDIGCGIGAACIAANSFGMNAFGIDIDPGRGLYQAIFEKNKSNFTFLKGDFLELSLKENNFDFIISTLTLDHIIDIKKFIERISNILLKDGFLVLSVPNLDSISNAVLGHRYARQWMITHENFFDLSHIKALLKMFNLTILSTITEWHPFFTIIRKPLDLSIFKELIDNKVGRVASRDQQKKSLLLGYYLKKIYRKYIQGEILYVIATKNGTRY